MPARNGGGILIAERKCCFRAEQNEQEAVRFEAPPSPSTGWAMVRPTAEELAKHFAVPICGRYHSIILAIH